MKSEAVIIGQCRLMQFGEKFYAVFDPLPGCDPDALLPLDDSASPEGCRETGEAQAG